jgi:acyl dehydratase
MRDKGRYWEDWQPGQEWTTAARTIGEAEVSLFAGLSGDFNPLHVDEEYCKSTVFGSRIAHGPLVYAVAAGLAFQLHLYDDTLIAFLGFNYLKFTSPVRIGDTIHARLRVTQCRETSKPDRGIVIRELKVMNQRDECVQEAEQVFLIRRRGASA